MSRVEFELPPLTLEAMDETWVPRDAEGMIDRELIIMLDKVSFRKLFQAIPCTERYTWPVPLAGLEREDNKFTDLVIRRPVVFRMKEEA